MINLVAYFLLMKFCNVYYEREWHANLYLHFSLSLSCVCAQFLRFCSKADMPSCRHSLSLIV
jgi:hypothetical protein